MVWRALLSFWFLVASVFAPAFCCCLSRSVALADASLGYVPPASAATKGCPHGKRAAAARDGDTQAGHPSPAGPGGDRCHCQDHIVASSAPDAVSLRVAQPDSWLPDLPPFVAAVSPHRATAKGESPQVNQCGPPPLAGVELLHRLHVLIC